MTTRRRFIGAAGVAGGLLSGGAILTASCVEAGPDAVSERLSDAIAQLPVDDGHAHPISDRDAQTTPDRFLERISLAAFPAPNYFPRGVFRDWQRGDSTTRARLDGQYRIADTMRSINHHFESSVFVKFMVKELARFLGCAPTLAAVIEARNARGRDYFGYISALFRDVRIENVMLDTGFTDGLDQAGMQRFATAIQPSRTRHIARVEALAGDLMDEDLAYPDLRDRFVTRVRDALDGTGNYGARSYGMKSYLLPDVGLITPVYDDAVAQRSWDEYRRARGREEGPRGELARRGQVLRERLLTIALEECLQRDMPMQFHAGDGEAPYVILRNQHPYYLEEVARFDKDGMMRMPKIIPIHAGYPLVGEAAWLSHLYTNVYFETSIMTPFTHQGIMHRFLEIMEAVPLSKILFGSDAYHVPELYWLAARWGKRYLARALAVYVRDGILDEAEALEAARMILYKNNRQVYNLDV